MKNAFGFGINVYMGINSTTYIYLRNKFQAFIKTSLMFPLSLTSLNLKLNNGYMNQSSQHFRQHPLHKRTPCCSHLDAW